MNSQAKARYTNNIICNLVSNEFIYKHFVKNFLCLAKKDKISISMAIKEVCINYMQKNTYFKPVYFDCQAILFFFKKHKF
jgi:hypothetical protein